MIKFASRLATCAALALLSVPTFAGTVTFDFAHLAGSAGDFRPNEVLNQGYWSCTGNDLCSSDLSHGVLGGDLKYTAGGIGVAATGWYKNGSSYSQVSVVQDHEPGYNAANQIGAGLGVYHLTNDNSDDNITGNEKLILTFNQDVKLNSLILRSDGHDTSWVNNSTFLFNGVSTKLSGTVSNLNLIGRTFSFEYGGSKADQFYLGGVVVSPVPEPETYAMLLLGLGALGLVARRRKAAK
jgi:hypothetical protein